MKTSSLNLNEDDIVMCTVKGIEGTTVFLHIEGDGEGSMTMSEVAAGRIRNIREYISPNKKIVCKILRITQDGHIQLSLRRVTGKEREFMQERFKKEKTLFNMLKAVNKDPEVLLSKIKEFCAPADFFDILKEKPKSIPDTFSKEEIQKLTKILAEKKEKEKVVKREIIIKSNSDRGVEEIKEVLCSVIHSIEIRYLGSSRFSLIAKSNDFKDASHKLAQALQDITQKAKERRLLLEIKEK